MARTCIHCGKTGGDQVNTRYASGIPSSIEGYIHVSCIKFFLANEKAPEIKPAPLSIDQHLQIREEIKWRRNND